MSASLAALRPWTPLLLATGIGFAVASLSAVVGAEVGEPEGVLRRARAAMARVAEVRGLAPRRSLCRRLVGRQRLVELVRERVRSQYGADDIRREGQILMRLGIIEESAGYEASVFEALGGTVAGYYDPVAECLYLVRGLEPEDLEEVMYHETAHALQDQHFDLERALRRRALGADRLRAISALVEGDATATAMAAMSNDAMGVLAGLSGGGWARRVRRRIGAEPAQGDIESHLQAEALFAYGEGMRFVSSLYRRGGWAAIDAAFRSPPESTEQVLHPELSASDAQPASVALNVPPGLPAGCRVVYEDTLGEATLAEWVGVALGRGEARGAVQGWGGDRAALVAGCDPSLREPALVVCTTWDGPGDGPARRFEAALLRSYRRRRGVTSGGGRGGATTFRTRRGEVWISRRGRRVGVVIGLRGEVGRAFSRAAVGVSPGDRAPR